MRDDLNILKTLSRKRDLPMYDKSLQQVIVDEYRGRTGLIPELLDYQRIIEYQSWQDTPAGQRQHIYDTEDQREEDEYLQEVGL